MEFRNEAAKFVYIRTYSRWIESEIRREVWSETVKRYIAFIRKHRSGSVPEKVFKKIESAILNFEVMPSMRALWAAGEAAESDNVTMYNCAFSSISSTDDFAEALYILMCGTGDGFSVQKQYIDKLPTIPIIDPQPEKIHTVQDSKAGWADSVKALVGTLLNGKDLSIEYHLLRPKGARLKTMGGRSSGPEPLITLHNFIRETLYKAQGRQLTSLESHDIQNQIAEIVVVGGVRRSSQISLSDLQDEAMRHAKEWPFPLRRAMANNSAVYYTKPTAVDFLKEWSALASSGTGERGISNLDAARKTSPSRRDASKIAGTNPCGEIMLRDKQFCNLSEVVVRPDDDLDSLLEKVETATWIGVIQSTFTHFPYLREEWKLNCEEERLLGVSLTGQLDNRKALTPDALKAMKSRAIKVAKRASNAMGVNMPAAITCVKPSGTVSQLVDSASGLHPRYAQYYIRRYRISATDPFCKMIKAQGMRLSPENGQKDLPESEVSTWVVSFPVKSPKGSVVKDDMTAIEQLEWYKTVQTNWCEHNASATIYVKDSEWFEVGNWVYKNWDIVNGLSFLPHDSGKYEQAPYEEITKEQYDKMVKEQLVIDYSQLSKFEMEDNTEGAKGYACVGDKCEIT